MLPKFPVASIYSIDFLKPGDTEILSRPLHIPEYLPSMIIREQNEIINDKNFDSLNQYQSMTEDKSVVLGIFLNYHYFSKLLTLCFYF